MQLQMLEESDDERYIKYEPVEEVRIFDVVVNKEETDMFEIVELYFEREEIIDNALVG